MDARGNRPETRRDPRAARSRIAGLVALCARLARAIRGGDIRPAPESRDVEDDVAAIIARRAERYHNRDSAAAAKYRRIHTILSRGRP